VTVEQLPLCDFYFLQYTDTLTYLQTCWSSQNYTCLCVFSTLDFT